MPSLFKPLPASFLYYLNAKKGYQRRQMNINCVQFIQNLIKHDGQEIYADFFKGLELYKLDYPNTERIIADLIVTLLRFIRRNMRLAGRASRFQKLTL